MSNHNVNFILIQSFNINRRENDSDNEYDSDESDSDESEYDSDSELYFLMNSINILIESELKHEKISINRDISYKKTNLLFETCNICYDKMANVKTKCNHDYCSECFSTYYSKNNENNECAYCRKELFNANGIILLTNDKKLLNNELN
jgi:hypothetical protein